MKILITGATGMVGAALVESLAKKHTLTLVGRSAEKLKSKFSDHHSIVTWDDLKLFGKKIIENQDVIINLTGENIGQKRWSLEQKKIILKSRLDATRLIANLCSPLGKNSPRILNASAIGAYGLSPKKGNHHPVNENTLLRDKSESFLEEVVFAWENALLPAEKYGVSIVRMRFGVVLSKKGGALKKMLPSFSLGLGAILGDGKQFFSWISLNDLIRAIEFVIDHPEISGPVNMVSPAVVSQKGFAQILSKTLKRRLFLRLPKKLVHFLFGQMGDELLLDGRFVKSDKLLNAGFQFNDADMTTTLQSILKDNKK